MLTHSPDAPVRRHNLSYGLPRRVVANKRVGRKQRPSRVEGSESPRDAAFATPSAANQHQVGGRQPLLRRRVGI